VQATIAVVSKLIRWQEGLKSIARLFVKVVDSWRIVDSERKSYLDIIPYVTGNYSCQGPYIIVAQCIHLSTNY